MIPTIGVMIGFYIIFRMVDAMASKTRGAFVKVCAALVIVTTVVSMVSLLEGSTRASGGIPSMLR